MFKPFSYLKPNPLKKIRSRYDVQAISGLVDDVLQKLSKGSYAYGVENILDPKKRVALDMRLGVFRSSGAAYLIFYAKNAGRKGEREFFYEPGAKRLIAGLINPSQRAKNLNFESIAKISIRSSLEGVLPMLEAGEANQKEVHLREYEVKNEFNGWYRRIYAALVYQI